MKRIFKIFIFILVILFVASNNFLAEEDDATNNVFTEGNLQYTIEGEGNSQYIFILYYFGNDSEFIIPWVIGPYEVKEIADGAFTHSNVSTIKIPENITQINPSSYKVGTTLIYYDAFGNEKEISTNNLSENEVLEETEELEEVIDPSFEEQSVDLDDEVFNDDEEGALEGIRKILRDSFLFNGGQFASNFASNPVGFVIIGVSIVIIVLIFVKYIRRRY